MTTDFGTADGYVGTVKGVILGINPGVTFVDISHDINPQDVFEAAFVLGTSYGYFPDNTIHLVVVDPGVGSQRRALALSTPSGVFVGPDNGVMTWPVLDYLGETHTLRSGLREVPRDSAVKAVSLTETRFWRRSVSSTFHARDVFGPVAGYLSLGTPVESLGKQVWEMFLLQIPAPHWPSSCRVDGEVLKIDRFGNLITNLKADALAQLGENVVFRVAGREIQGLSNRYGEKAGLLALVGSSGYVEIALQNGSAAQALDLARGAGVSASKLS